MDRSAFRKTISGQATGWSSGWTRTVLGLLEPVYRTVVQQRNRAYDRQPRKSVSLPVPVISVGNLTTGGTGKTPLVRWLAGLLQCAGCRPVIVSRGYGSRHGQPNDEARELALYLPEVPHVQNPDRVAAARAAMDQYSAGSIVMDDGFQHRRLHRDLDIVLVDATCPFGFDHLLPRGLLREPVESLARASAVVITRCNLVTRPALDDLVRQIETILPRQRIAGAEFEMRELWNLDGTAGPLDELAGQPVVAFCGIGNPAAFREALTRQSIQLVDFVEWPDHHRYGIEDIRHLQSRARDHAASRLLCTVKDLVKIRELRPPAIAVQALAISTRFVAGEEMLRQQVLGVCAGNADSTG